MYAKIFDSIYDGSLRRDWKALVVFQQLLILCDQEGYVDKTIDAISKRTTIPEDIVRHGIAELSKPDPESRSQEHEGRRIVLIAPHRNWGWRVVNYGEYRDIKNQDQLRDYWRGKKKEQRSKTEVSDRTFELKKKLSLVYSRKESDKWTYMEECLLAEVARREDCMSELEELVRFKARESKYFPRSLQKVLSEWTATIDRSRVKITAQQPPEFNYNGNL